MYSSRVSRMIPRVLLAVEAEQLEVTTVMTMADNKALILYLEQE